MRQALSTRAVAKVLGCGNGTVSRYLRFFGISTEHSKIKKVEIPKQELIDLYIKKRKPSTAIAKIYNCSDNLVLRRLREYQIPARSITEAHMKYSKRDFDGNFEEKAYLLGFRIGDLHIRKFSSSGETIAVECASSIKAQLNLIKSLFADYGAVVASPPNGKEIRRITCYVNSSFRFLLTKRKKVPKWVMKREELFLNFLAGYIDAEGSFITRSGGTSALFRLGSCDLLILQQIYKQLTLMGLKRLHLYKDRLAGSVTFIRIGVDKDRRRTKDKKCFLNKDYWRLELSEKKSLLLLLNLLEPYLRHKEKKGALLRAKENIIWRNKKYGNLII